MADKYQATAAALKYALILGDENGWAGLSLVIFARLTRQEKAALAYATLCTMPDNAIRDVADLAIFGNLEEDQDADEKTE